MTFHEDGAIEDSEVCNRKAICDRWWQEGVHESYWKGNGQDFDKERRECILLVALTFKHVYLS